MANVVVTIAGRPYTMQCRDGEEPHLRDLANLLDVEVSKVRQGVGAVGDIRQLVMAGLMVADRLSEATKKIEALEDQLNGLRDSRNQLQGQLRQMDENFAKALDIAAAKMEDLVKV